MIDGLVGLRHHAVVGRNDQYHDVGHLCATGAHLGECLVARGVDKDDNPIVFGGDARSADVLRDAAGFLLSDPS